MGDLIAVPESLAGLQATIAGWSDEELDRQIVLWQRVEEVAPSTNRLMRVERGRRTDKSNGRNLTPGVRTDAYEQKRRSEEMLVADWYDHADDAHQYLEVNGWRKCVTAARNWKRAKNEPVAPPPVTKPDLGGGVSHPARFSEPIMEALDGELPEDGVVLDPFAGTGRIHELATDTRRTVGIEIEPEWAEMHPDTKTGNALDIFGTTDIQPESVDAVATSPTYGNRLADSHNASDADTRRSYTHDLGRRLHEDNSGQMQWGDEYRQFHLRAYGQSIQALKPGGTFIINVSDHIRKGHPQQVVMWHAWALGSLGLEWEKVTPVETRRLKQGSNASARVDYEYVLTFRKPPQ